MQKPTTHQISPHRLGNIAAYYANEDKAKELLGWQAYRTLEEMCASNWR